MKQEINLKFMNLSKDFEPQIISLTAALVAKETMNGKTSKLAKFKQQKFEKCKIPNYLKPN